jgi:hypothetical protein
VDDDADDDADDDDSTAGAVFPLAASSFAMYRATASSPGELIAPGSV